MFVTLARTSPLANRELNVKMFPLQLSNYHRSDAAGPRASAKNHRVAAVGAAENHLIGFPNPTKRVAVISV